MNRYIVEEGSASAHCCFEYSILDTTHNEYIAECFTRIDAELICKALNNE